MNTNFQKIYEDLKKRHEDMGWEVNEGRLKQQTWMLRNRMISESSSLQSSSSSAGAGAGGGGGRIPGKRIDDTANNYVENDYVSNYFL